MIDYIKREDAKNMMRKFRGYYDEDAIAKFEIALGAGYIPPNEDVIEVVRCKDCKYGDTFHEFDDPEMPMKCIGRHYGWTYPDDFCSYAERRTDG